jgi:hypothetical protein
MGIFNRRNAVLGWLGWLVGKRVLKRKLSGLRRRRGNKR